MLNLKFNTRLYDEEGMCFDEGLFLHMGSTILRFENPDELEAFALKIQSMLPEIRDVY